MSANYITPNKEASNRRSIRDNILKRRNPIFCKDNHRIEDVEEGECRYHIEGRGFCRAPQKAGSSYCADCQPKMVRKDQPKPYSFSPDYQPKNFKYQA